MILLFVFSSIIYNYYLGGGDGHSGSAQSGCCNDDVAHVLCLLTDFRKQLKEGVERPVFNPNNFDDLDLDRTAWSGAARSTAPEPTAVKA